MSKFFSGDSLLREALLPGTDALPANTVQFESYDRKILVRYRDAAGSVRRESFEDRASAAAFFWECCREMHMATKRALYER